MRRTNKQRLIELGKVKVLELASWNQIIMVSRLTGLKPKTIRKILDGEEV